MTITVKLFASFRIDRFSIEQRSYPDNSLIAQVVDDLALPREALGIIMVNSRHAPLDRPLAEGDTLALFPKLGGG